MAPTGLIFLFGKSAPRCTHRIDKPFDGHSTFQYMIVGAVDLTVNGRRHAMRGRWFWSGYPGPRVACGPAAGPAAWPHRCHAFTGPPLWRWERDGLFPIPPRPACGGADLGRRFDDLLALPRLTNRRGHLRAVDHLEPLLLDPADAPAADAPPAQWLDAAVAQITAWSRAAVAPANYAALADRLGMSVSTLGRRSFEATGTSLHVYLLQCRGTAAAAGELLGGTDLPIKAIAGRLGYRGVYFFSLRIRQQGGVPTAAYRRTRRG